MSSKTRALLKWLDTDASILARIEVLVVISGALMTFLALFGSYRRRSRSSAMKLTLWAAYLLTDSISAYTIASIGNSYIKGSIFTVPIVIFWLVTMVKFWERTQFFGLVSEPNPPMINTKLVSDYMHYEHELSNEDEADPALMKGYKYLVIGEEEKDVKIGPPDYLMKLMLEDTAVLYAVVTVEKIWRCPGRVLKNSEEAKDVCLAFALFKLLRRCFTGYPWAEANLLKSKKLILEGLFGYHNRAFRVIETELAFLYDSFYTKYAIVSVKQWTLLSSVATLVGSFWVAVILAHYKPPSGEEYLSRSVDALVTIFFLVAITFVEFWQFITYVFSDWAKVLLLCNYVRKATWQEMDFFQTLLSFVCRQRLLKP
ncbi:hypothetical protein J5N97_011577 [Dioscorea zingiberensis]|uniref:DUF4220 domain-containing protein n=1 Tax=Dioscorea zingiberensis TaxID=325984 RepID=A0A9D5D2Z5_9LILI|nr:hypothetical protein J5N97_011577 [Dioscorea zingiberensis]